MKRITVWPKFRFFAIMILLILLAAAFFKGGAITAVGVLQPSGQVINLNSRWVSAAVQEKEAGSAYEYKIPEDMTGPLVLCQESYWCGMKVYLDGEEIYSYEDPYKEKGRNRHWIEIPEGSGSRVLTLLLKGSEKLTEQTIRGDNYLGDRGSVFYEFLRSNLSALIYGGIILLMGCVMLFSNIYMRIRFPDRTYMGGWYLMFFFLLAGIWILTDSQLLQIATGKTGLFSLASFLSFMAMPFFLVMFIQEMLVQRRRMLDILCVLFLINLGGCLLLYLLRVLPLFMLLSGVHFLIVLSVFFLLKYGIEEIISYQNKEIKKVRMGLGILTIFCVMALIVFYWNPAGGYSHLFSIGLIFFAVSLMSAVFEKLYYYLRSSASMEVYKELAYIDLLTGIENRNAFMEYQEKQDLPARLAILIFDVNHLKRINDQYGHQEGDQVIQNAADSIREAFGRIGSCYRVGGDEFAVSISNTSEEEIQKLLEKWEKILKKINRNSAFPAEIACGYAVRDSEDVSVSELFAQADDNMYHNKNEMKGFARNS